MRSLLVMGIPYQYAPEVSIVRGDTLPGKGSVNETVIIQSSRSGSAPARSVKHGNLIN